eukprot:CAMPEP_0181296702 /NCGR_PEP_ID=MMETSP1101-20121128/4845_1 /TAXON_ID=46948 /ORGANISM="Rhodomonas abbreviata, Strain Caron Lab Isolate" /LENGTH=227 /DNA_ID=CAMNT_0023401585 /DNA_START=52 /DNA_END=735 /DNA_ORIENTATION=+
MADQPSWLTEENISTATKVANNPAAQGAAKSAAKAQAAKSAPGWGDSSSDVEQGGAPAKPAKPAGGNKPIVDTDMSDMDPSELKEMQNWHLALRILYMGAAGFLATAAALSLQNQKDLGLIFFAFYVMFFSTMICCFEVALQTISRLIAVNFGFMYSFWGRIIFLILVGFMSFLLSVFGKVAMGILYAVAAFHLFIMYKFPRFEEYLRKKHYFEGRQANKQLASQQK